MAGQRAEDADTRSLWFNLPDDGETNRRALTRERVVAEALAVISTDGAEALSMRALARRLGVVPGALYRHVRSKEQLYDLILDAVLAEVDCRTDPALPWTAQVAMLAHRLRAVLENHSGVAALLKTRDPISPASLALAEAFLAPLHAAGLPDRQAAWAFRLIYDYTLGFALSDPTSPGEQRVQDTATRRELHDFLRSLPASRFPTLTALGAYAWADDRDQRFTASLETLISGLQAAHHPEGSSTSPGPQPRGLPGRPRVLHRGAVSRRRSRCSTEIIASVDSAPRLRLRPRSSPHPPLCLSGIGIPASLSPRNHATLISAPVSCRLSPGQVEVGVCAGQQVQDLADGAFPPVRFGQREVGLDVIAVAAAVLLLDHVAGLDQVRDDAEGAAFGDVQAVRDVAQAYPGVMGDQQQDPRMGGQERPARHAGKVSDSGKALLVW